MSRLVEISKSERGELQRSWRDVEEITGVGRDTVLRRAWDELARQNPRAPRLDLEKIMATNGVVFEDLGWGYRVEVRRPGKRHRVWLKPL